MARKASLEPIQTTRKIGKWMVNLPSRYSQTGKRERHFFRTKDTAETFCNQARTRIGNYGTQAALLTPGQAEEAVQAFDKLASFGVSLNRVLEDWIVRRKQSQSSIHFEKLLDEFALAGRKNRARSAGYRQSIQQVRNRLISLHGRVVSEITPREIEEAVHGMTPSVRNYTLKILSCAFNLAVARSFATENPLRKVEQTHVVSKEIAVYSPQQVATIMSAVEENDFNLIPFFAVSFFAGVRRSELLRMDWSHVNTRERYIRLPKDLTKTNQGRHIPIEPNLRKWLIPHVREAGPVVPISHNMLRRRERALKSKHQIPIIKHGPRHCFGTYWLAMHENINRLMLSLGHTDFETTQEHYAKAATKKDAQLFWKIIPKPFSATRKVIQFSVA